MHMGQTSSNKKKTIIFAQVKTPQKTNKQTNKQGFCLFPSGVEQTGTKFKTAVIWMGEWIGSWSSLSVIAIACAPGSFG